MFSWIIEEFLRGRLACNQKKVRRYEYRVARIGRWLKAWRGNNNIEE